MEKPTILNIKCKRHGIQKAIAVIGGEIWCNECQKEYIKNREKEEFVERFK